jgi:glucokinase
MALNIGIDIGGTKTALGLVDGVSLLKEVVLPTLEYEGTLQAVATVCREWMDRSAVSAIGIACSGPLRPSEGIVLNRDTLPGWYGRNLVRDLERSVALKPALLNDADAALIGELFAGVLADHSLEPAVMLTFGTGVGGAFWDGHRVLIGAGEEHPEIGHVLATPGGPTCYCGLGGCLESVASGTALYSMATTLGFEDLAGLVAASQSGNTNANEALGKVKTAIRDALWSLVHAYRPAYFVLGGGVMEGFFGVLAPASLPVKASTVPGEPPRIVPAKLGNRAGIWGAAIAAGSLTKNQV